MLLSMKNTRCIKCSQINKSTALLVRVNLIPRDLKRGIHNNRTTEEEESKTKLHEPRELGQ